MSNTIETLDLSSNDGEEGMTQISNSLIPTVKKPEEEKNVDNKVNSMDSTPISELEMHDPNAQMMMAPPQAIPSQMMMAPPPMQQVQAQAPPVMQSKYPGNLTEEQIESLLVAAVAIISFSKPIQERLAGMIPNFMDGEGSKTMTGMVVTGILAAILFYFIRRFIVKN